MPITELATLKDPRLEPYRDLRNRNWIERSGIFIAEGPVIVEQALRSDYLIKSLLVDRKYLSRFLPLGRGIDEVYVLEHELVRELVGFPFHRGVLACGIRKPRRSIAADASANWKNNELFLGLLGLQDPENLGAILRSAAAFGVRHVLLGPGTADPLARRALRVSAGLSLLPTFHSSKDFLADLKWLQEVHNVEVLSTCTSTSAEPLREIEKRGPQLVLIGNEGRGLPDEIVQAADRRLRIEMVPHIDSLNAAVAASIVLYQLSQTPVTWQPVRSPN
jgi:tRNA G18 (ribose-2'-O)-methylase SpoU